VDAVSQSFVERADDIHKLRAVAASLGCNPFIIAKIERSRALNSIDEIIQAADGLMIARGDLGVELPIEQMAIVQKRVMHLANMRAKPVITATQMLESMISNRRPTRAEATDVANAILDGTDCVMLSAESAVGSYPVESVAMLAKIATATEPHRSPIGPKELFAGIDLKDKVPEARLTDLAIDTILQYSSRAIVFVRSHEGNTARSITRLRPAAWIIAVSPLQEACRKMQFSFGVHAVHQPETPQDWMSFSSDWLRANDVDAELLVLAEGGDAGTSDGYRMEIADLKRMRANA
jgi:pyruvate kinase